MEGLTRLQNAFEPINQLQIAETLVRQQRVVAEAEQSGTQPRVPATPLDATEAPRMESLNLEMTELAPLSWRLVVTLPKTEVAMSPKAESKQCPSTEPQDQSIASQVKACRLYNGLKDAKESIAKHVAGC